MATPRLNLELMNKAELGLVQGENPRGLASRLALEFQMTERTVWRYFRKIRERWASEEVEHREQRRQHFRAMIMANFRLAMATSNPMAGAATLRVLAKLDGLEVPAKLKIAGSFDVRSMSPTERRSEIDRLIALRAQSTRQVDT